MESTEKISETTELLTKAFSQIHGEVFVPRNLDNGGKFQEVATPIILALDTVNEFGCVYDEKIVNLLDIIKDKFKGTGRIESEVSSLCTDILKLTIAANRFVYNYRSIAIEMQKSLDESYNK